MLMNVGLVWRRPEPEFALDEFAATWAGPYAALVMSHPEVAFYMQCIVTDTLRSDLQAVAGEGAELSGIALVGFDSAADAAAMRDSETMAAAPALADTFCDRIRSEFCEVEALNSIGAEGLATFTSGDVDDGFGAELRCRALSRKPSCFTRLVLHREPARSGATGGLVVHCNRHLMRSPT